VRVSSSTIRNFQTRSTAARVLEFHATGADLAEPRIYETVRLTLARNFRSVWKTREITGELMY
jgi:hypothetical protein